MATKPRTPQLVRQIQKSKLDAVNFLHDTMLNTQEKTDSRIKCASMLLDRDTGDEKPRETIEVVLGNFEELAK